MKITWWGWILILLVIMYIFCTKKTIFTNDDNSCIDPRLACVDGHFCGMIKKWLKTPCIECDGPTQKA